MFVGGSIKFGKDFRLFLGGAVGPTKREVNFAKFMTKSINTVTTLYNQIYKNLGVKEYVFNYAVETSSQIEIKTYMSENNYRLVCTAFDCLNKAKNLIQQSSFTEDISLSGKEKITSLIFEAQDSINKLTNEPSINDRLLNDLAVLENKSVFAIKRLAKRNGKPTKKWYRSWWFLLIVVIVIYTIAKNFQTNQSLENQSVNPQEQEIIQQEQSNNPKTGGL